jgi:hypothetical protein
MHVPDEENKPHYLAIFNALSRSTDEHLKALEAFSQIAWRE